MLKLTCNYVINILIIKKSLWGMIYMNFSLLHVSEVPCPKQVNIVQVKNVKDGENTVSKFSRKKAQDLVNEM